jgi:transposase
MRPFGSALTLEHRRRKAIGLLLRGTSMEEVGRRVAASVSSVSRWYHAHQEGGAVALAPKKASGRPPKLPRDTRTALWNILLKGALAYGYPNDLWTLKRIRAVIQKEYGVTYHPGHVWKILHKAGWSCQVPERRSIQRDEDKIAHWKRYTWPAIKKSPKTWGPPRLPR